MAYFQKNESYQKNDFSSEEEQEEYDDGFDELNETQEEPEITEEERTQRKQSRVRLAFDAGNLFGVISGAVLILVLLTLIFSIVHFMINDIGRSFSLFQTNF